MAARKNNGKSSRANSPSSKKTTTPKPKDSARTTTPAKKPKRKKIPFLVRLKFLFKPDVKKIFKTTDGYFDNRPHIKKPRKVAVIDQRDDGAVAVVKIYKKKDKVITEKKFLKEPILLPDKHKSLTETSLIGNQLFINNKRGTNGYQEIKATDFKPTKDKLNNKELSQIKKNLKNENKETRQKHNKKMKKWRKHFK